MLEFAVAVLIAWLVAPVVINFYTRRGWLDDPEKHKHAKVTHQKPVPRGGGIVVFLAIVISALLFLEVDRYLVAILAGGFLLTVVGTLDDVLDLHPLIRLGAGFVAALLVVGSGIGIAYVSHPFQEGVIHLDQPQLSLFLLGKERSIWLLADLFALFFIVWNMNIVNWSKGVDGQMPGFVVIAMVVIGLLSFNFVDDPTQFNTALFSFIVAGAFLGLLYWNWYPQKIMPGYGAGSLAGFFLAITAIISGAKVATMLMVLGIPTADAVFTILRRLRAGKSPFWGDRGHLHHKLIDVFKWDKRQVAVFYWASSLAAGALSFYLTTLGKVVTIVAITGFVFTILIWAKYRQVVNARD